MKNSLLLMPLLTLTTLAACGEPAYHTTLPSQEQGATPNVVQDSPDIATQALQWCQPQAISYDTQALPKLPQGVARENFCDIDAPEGAPETSASQVISWDEANNLLRVENNGATTGLPYEHNFTLDAENRVRNLFVQGANGFYTTEFGASWYDMDERGEMTHKVAARMQGPEAPEEDWEVLVKAQTWDGDRLLERVERDGQDGPIVRTWSWSYNQERLIQATMTDTHDPENPILHQTRWSYDDQGRPSLVERSIDDVMVSREAWTYHPETSAVATRDYWARSTASLIATEGGTEQEWTLVDGLDDHTHPTPDYEKDPWSHALPQTTETCTRLPTGAGHGYPDAEPEHQLGVARTERPHGIGFKYGNDSYAWFYGDFAWYGHHGLGSAWLGQGFAARPDITSTHITYNDQGLMISEEANIELQGQSAQLMRNRLTDTDGHITQDTLVATQGDQTNTRTLLFERNEAKHLTARYLMEGDQILDTQTWTHDAQGRVTGHTIEPRPALPSPSPSLQAVLSGFGDIEIPTASTWFWRYEGALLVERGSTGQDPLNQSMVYDNQGRMIRQEGTFLVNDHIAAQTWRYDDKGRLDEHCVNYNTDHGNCTRTTYDAAGRVAWRMLETNDQQHVIEHNEYTCE